MMRALVFRQPEVRWQEGVQGDAEEADEGYPRLEASLGAVVMQFWWHFCSFGARLARILAFFGGFYGRG